MAMAAMVGIPPAPCGPPMAPAMMPPTWPGQEPQWHPGGPEPPGGWLPGWFRLVGSKGDSQVCV